MWVCAVLILQISLIGAQSITEAGKFFPAPSDNLRKLTSQSPLQVDKTFQLLQNPFIANTLVGQNQFGHHSVNPEIVRNPILSSYFDKTRAEELQDVSPFQENRFLSKQIEFPQVPIPTKPKHLENSQMVKINPISNFPSTDLPSKVRNKPNTGLAGPTAAPFFIPPSEKKVNAETIEDISKFEIVTTPQPLQVGNFVHATRENNIQYQGEIIKQANNPTETKTSESRGRISRNNRPVHFPRLRTTTEVAPSTEKVTETTSAPKIITYRPPLKLKVGTVAPKVRQHNSQRTHAPSIMRTSHLDNLQRKNEEFINKIASLPKAIEKMEDLNVNEEIEEQTERLKKSRKEIQEELFNEQAHNAKYAFSSDVNDEISSQTLQREETREDGKVKGKYSYSDGYVKRTVYYEADDQGYRVVKEEVENLGDGPIINPQGNAHVRSEYSGSKIQYDISSRDIQKQRHRSLYKSFEMVEEPKSEEFEDEPIEEEEDYVDDKVTSEDRAKRAAKKHKHKFYRG